MTHLCEPLTGPRRAVKAVGIINCILGALQLGWGVLIFLLVTLILPAVANMSHVSELSAGQSLGTAISACIMAVCGVAGIAGGKGLLRGAPWARRWTLGLAGVHVGLALAAVAWLWIALQQQVGP